MNITFFITLAGLIIIAGCVNQAGTKPYACNADSDCEIKDVHNCCGYYPGCVNKNYFPDIEAVKKECEKKGIVSICGWPEITGCECINNSCESVQGEMIV